MRRPRPCLFAFFSLILLLLLSSLQETLAASQPRQRRRNTGRGRPPRQSSASDALPTLEQLPTFPFVDLVELRPSRQKGGDKVYANLFAHHPDVVDIARVSDNTPEGIAKELYKLRLKGIRAGKGRQWNTQLTWSIAMYGKKVGWDPTVIEAIKGYHTMKLKSNSAGQSSSHGVGSSAPAAAATSATTTTGRPTLEVAQARLEYQNQRSTNTEAYLDQQMTDRKRARVKNATKIKKAAKVMENLMKQFDYRPDATQVEIALRDIIFLYPSVRTATCAVRAYMQRQRYTKDEIQLAIGARGRFNRDYRIQRKRWDKAKRKEAQSRGDGLEADRDEVMGSSAVGPSTPAPSRSTEQMLIAAKEKGSTYTPLDDGQQVASPRAETPRLETSNWWDNVRDWQ